MIPEFFEAIWPYDPLYYGEIRAINGDDHGVYQDWVPLDENRGVLAAHLAGGIPARDIYFGVLPRIARSGTAQDCADTTVVLWADVDGKDFDTNLVMGKPEALSALLTIAPSPSIIVDSGGGYHGYWLLRHEVPYTVAREVMVGVAKAANGDHTYDAPRVMRVPGTLNYKRQPIEPARLIRFDLTRKYGLGDFDPYRMPPEAPRSHVARPDAPAGIPGWLDDLLASEPAVGARSEALFRAGLWLWRYGYDENQIADIFRTAPLGEKYRELGRQGDRWLHRAILKYND